MDIYALLYRLGVTANYTGFFQTASAVRLCMEQPERLLLVTKWVYPDVARQYKTSWKAVERNIRTVNGLVWKQNRPFLEKLVGRELLSKPSNAQLLAILSYSLRSQSPGSLAVHEREIAETEESAKQDTKSLFERADTFWGARCREFEAPHSAQKPPEIS